MVCENTTRVRAFVFSYSSSFVQVSRLSRSFVAIITSYVWLPEGGKKKTLGSSGSQYASLVDLPCVPVRAGLCIFEGKAIAMVSYETKVGEWPTVAVEVEMSRPGPRERERVRCQKSTTFASLVMERAARRRKRRAAGGNGTRIQIYVTQPQFRQRGVQRAARRSETKTVPWGTGRGASNGSTYSTFLGFR
jgi:hypothetical protein